MESANGLTVIGNKINRVPFPRVYPVLQRKTSHYLYRISLHLELEICHSIFDFYFMLKNDTYAGLGVVLPYLFLSCSRRAFKHVCFHIKSVVPATKRTFPQSQTPSPLGLPDPTTPEQMYPNTSTPQVTTPSITPLSHASPDSHNASFDTPILASSPTLVPINSTVLYAYNDRSTLPGVLNSTKDDNYLIVTSLVTSFVSNETLGSNGSLLGTPGNDIQQPYSGLSRNNIVLITSLCIVIGCFAITALLLRIGSRVMKARKEAEERRRRRRHAVRRNQGKRSPRITIQQVRVRIEPDRKGKRANKGSTKQIRAQPNRLSIRQRQEREAETSFITLPQTSTRRTDGALVGIAACSTDVALGKGMVSTLKGESFTSETELLDAFDQHKRKHRDNEYDNPIMNAKDPDEELRHARRTSTETETPFTSDTSNVPSWNNSPLHFLSGRTMRRPSSPERTSLPCNPGERSDVARESSESGSNGDVHRRIKLMRMHGRRNSGNNSKDSGYAGGSFASQDSSRNLLAYRDLREDQHLKRETKDAESTRDATPVIFEMENETAPLVRLSRSKSTNLQPSRRYNLQVPPHHTYYHSDVTRTNSHPYLPHQVRPIRRVMDSSLSGRRAQFEFYPRELSGHDRYSEYPYIVDCPPLYYEDSYFNFSEQSQQPARSHRMTNNPIYRLPPQDSQQYSPNLFPSLSSFPTPSLNHVPYDDRSRFVKRRTASTQTPTDNSPETPTTSPPSSPSIIRWYREGGSFVLVPRDDMDLDFLGPVYLAESMSDSDQSLSEPPTITMVTNVEKDLRQEQPRDESDLDSETESNRTGTSDSGDDEEGTKVSSKDEDSVKDESSLLLGAGSSVSIHDTKL